MTVKLTIKHMDFEAWEKEFQPIENHLSDDAGLGGLLFETYGEEVLYVVGVSNAREPNLYVWTYIDGDDGTVVVDGYHYVNRIGYLVTKKAPDPAHFYEVSV
jgi:hypothetical protein